MITRASCLLAALLAMPATNRFFQQNPMPATEGDVRARIVGVWRGNSVCVDKSSPCRDEVNVYKFSAVAGQPGEFSGTASKVVNGSEVLMGSAHWKYDAEKHVLESQVPPIRLVIRGAEMEGDLSLPDGKRYRHIFLKKAN